MNGSASALPSIAIPVSQPPQATDGVVSATQPPAVVVFGPDDKRKPHASWFSTDQAEGAMAAASVMGMYALPVADTAAELLALVAQLPRGKLFGSGKAFVPFVAAGTYEALLKHLPEGTKPPLRLVSSAPPASAPAAGTGPAGGKPVKYELPADWSQIKEGCLVLAHDPDGWVGWYEAIVVEAKPADIFWLTWRDFPEDKPIARHRSHLGLLPPNATTAS